MTHASCGPCMTIVTTLSILTILRLQMLGMAYNAMSVGRYDCMYQPKCFPLSLILPPMFTIPLHLKRRESVPSAEAAEQPLLQITTSLKMTS